REVHKKYTHTNQRNLTAAVRIRVSRCSETSGFPGSLQEANPKPGGETIRDAKPNSSTFPHPNSAI
ncbi:hypothetical protein, partial [Planococcus sp. ISL-109]|uniref:hypothetical protein n=1 Tax=Planococcus sp. ISL-109 TaxID=2819166 RepID=UPI001BEBD616